MGKKLYEEQLEIAKKEKVKWLRVQAATKYFGIGRTKLMEIAKDAGAKSVMNNNMVWIDCDKINDYIDSFRE